MEKFYSITIKRAKDEVLLEVLDNYDQVKLHGGDITITSMLDVKIAEGRVLYDILGFQDTSNFAISDKLRLLLIENKITGWRCYPLNIYGITNKYFGFQITSRCGEVLHPKEIGFYSGVKFDIKSWDGSDIFSPQGTVANFCTQKVRDLLTQNNLTNISIINLNQVQAYSTGS